MFFGADRDRLVKEMFLAAEEWRRAHLSEEGEGSSATRWTSDFARRWRR